MNNSGLLVTRYRWTQKYTKTYTKVEIIIFPKPPQAHPVTLPPYGKSHWTRSKRKERWRDEHPCYWPLLYHLVNLLAAVECLFDRSYALKIYMDLLYHRSLAITLCDWVHLAIGVYHWTFKSYIIWCRWLELVLDKQALYLDNHWWKLLISIILAKQDIYLDVILPLELLDEHYHRLLSLNEHYHRSLIGIINCYHRSRNKTYIWRIFNVIEWTSWYIWWSWLMNNIVWMNNVPKYLISS